MAKTILITGASEGIGAATAYLAARQGYVVAVNYRQSRERAEAVVSNIIKGGGQAVALQADISIEADVERLFREFDRALGRLDALVNNAAIIESQQRLVEMSGARLQHTFATNVFGSFFCAREAVKRMSTENGGAGGCIVNISSMAAKSGSPFEYIDYAATKGAIDTMTVGLAREVAAQNIRVNAVRPGIIDTAIHAKGGEPNRIERVKERVPFRRAGQPEEVARAVLWLLSDEASYVTGALFDVSGGL
jgi:NAD(P)-dependent dehydrogenase (short-subunit alcohol dehydrogenase family)